MKPEFTKVMENKETTLWNVADQARVWAEIQIGTQSEVQPEGTEYFCPNGLFVVDDGAWKEIETTFIDEHAAYYVEGGKPSYVTFANLVSPSRGSEETKRGERGEVYEVEGGALRVSDDGFGWEWVEEQPESSRPRLVLLKPDEEIAGENLWTNEFHDLWTALQAFDVREEGAEEMGGAILLNESFGLGIWKAIQALPGFQRDSEPGGYTPIVLIDDQGDLYDLLEDELEQFCSW